MSGRDVQKDEQARLLSGAKDRAGKKLKEIAFYTGIPLTTLHSWIIGEERFPLPELGRFIRGLGDTWFLNEILRPWGYCVIELPAVDGVAELAEQVSHFSLAANRLTQACGKVAGRIADATDIASPGGRDITALEADEVVAACDETMAHAAALKECVKEKTSNAN